MTNLEGINSDILQLVIRCVCDVSGIIDCDEREHPWKHVLPLSLVSKGLRAECLPHIFRECRHTLLKPGEFLPAHLWKHIQILLIVHPGVSLDDLEDQCLACIELYDAFPSLEAVKACVYTRVPGPVPMFTHALATLPSLTTLEIRNSTFQQPIDPEFHVIKCLTKFVFHLNTYWRRQYPTSVWSNIEAYYLMILLSGSSSTLEYLEVPASSVYIVEMARWQWPNLRHLVLNDNARPSDAPMISLLERSPRIRTLDIRLSRTSSEPRFVIYPSSDTQLSLFHAGNEVPRLTSLTLTNPSPDDLIFHFLSDVHYLSLSILPIPYCYAEGVSLLKAPIWEAKLAVKSLLHCEKHNLVELRLSVQGEGFSDLIRTISATFLSLKTLELHHFPKEPPADVQPFDIPFVDLARLPCLKELRLDLNVPFDVNSDRTEGPTPAMTNIEHKRSLLIAENLPRLERIGFLFRRKNGAAFWSIRNIYRSPELDVELEPLYWERFPSEV